MKNFLAIIFSFAFLFYTGCSSDEGNPTGTGGIGGGGGGGGTGNVTITAALVQDNQGQNHFQFTPSTTVVVDQIRAQCTAQQIDQTVQGDGQTAFSQADGFSIGPVGQDVLQTGQQWTFTIQGKIGSSTGTAYNVNVNYTIP